jgi:hypothetical protein
LIIGLDGAIEATNRADGKKVPQQCSTLRKSTDRYVYWRGAVNQDNPGIDRLRQAHRRKINMG